MMRVPNTYCFFAMSAPVKRRTVRDISAAMQESARPLVCLTAYTAPVAKAADAVADVILVGDSLGTVLYGYDSTLPVTVEMMIRHGETVVRCTERAAVLVDLPFGSYQRGPEQAFDTAAKIMRDTGCTAVKLEGGEDMAETVRFLTARGIPVCGHIGMQPQHSNMYGGFVAQGRNADDAARIRRDAQAIEEAGAFAYVLESVPRAVADDITAAAGVPVIGIGASPSCRGQILVTEDLAGMFDGFTPKFVRRYADMAAILREACAAFAADVRGGAFPADKECY